MRISDWSSDVCSSDLRQREDVRRRRDIPVLPALVTTPESPADAGGVDDRMPHPADGVVVEPPVLTCQRDRLGQLHLVGLRFGQQSITLTARPPSLVSLYFVDMSMPVCRIVSTTVSRET